MQLKQLVQPSDKVAIPALLFLWFLLQLWGYSKFGITSSADTPFYIAQANDWLEGTWPEGRERWYSSYSLTIALVIAITGSASYIVVVQVLLSLVAMLALYKLGNEVSKQYKAGFIACIMYLFFFKLQQWNYFIYAESLAISGAIIVLCFLVKAKKMLPVMLTAVVLCYVVFLRPNGLGVLVASFMYLIAHTYQKRQLIKQQLVIGSATFIIMILYISNRMLATEVASFIDSYSRGELVYPNHTLGFKPDQNLTKPSPENPPLLQLLLFAVQNSWYFLQLCMLKLVLFIFHVKPYFSIFHNIYLLLFLPVVYLYFCSALKIVPLPVAAFALTVFTLQAAIVSISSENWDGRFLLPVLPPVFLVAAIGLKSYLNKYMNLN